jgi:integrase/recombinase XerD
VSRIESTLLTSYKATWPELYPSTNTQAVVQQRLKTFLRHCNNARWLPHVPKMSPVRIDECPTRPLTCPRCGTASCVKHKESEYLRLLAAVSDAFTNGNAKRVRALIQLMRWSGLAIRDASCLRRHALTRKGKYYAVTAKRQKIVARVGEAAAPEVCVPIPAEIGREILAAANGDPDYVFWTPKTCTGVSFAHDRSADISRVFTEAGIECQGGMVSHRLRDTFACSLLEKGVPLEDVSRLLGHRSIVTTEKHYAPWVKGRQDRLDALVTASWAKKR